MKHFIAIETTYTTTSRLRQKAALAVGWGAWECRQGWHMGGGCAPSPENFGLFNLKMAYFDAHLRYLTYLF